MLDEVLCLIDIGDGILKRISSDKDFITRNIDTIIFADAPKLGPYRKHMQRNLSTVLKVDPVSVNIKATTTEGLGVIGKGEGIGAMCVVLVE